MKDDIEVLCHSSIKITYENIIYFDPFHIKKDYKDADIIFITHNHYDHFSKDDIEKVRKENTKIVIPKSMHKEALEIDFKEENIVEVEPNCEYMGDEMKFETIPAYNIDKQFHPKENNWVGYIIYINDISYYIAGDTDITEENLKVVCDIALVPVGGTYTMDYKEAADLVNRIHPKLAIPTHYGDIVGNKEDGESFKKLLNNDIECKILIK